MVGWSLGECRVPEAAAMAAAVPWLLGCHAAWALAWAMLPVLMQPAVRRPSPSAATAPLSRGEEAEPASAGLRAAA